MTGKISLVLNAILLLAVVYLFTQLNGKQDKKKESVIKTSLEPDTEKVYPSIAWVHNDSLAANYNFIKDKSVDLEKLNNEIAAADKEIANNERRYVKLMESLQKYQSGGNNYSSQEEMDKDIKELAYIEQNVPDLQNRLQVKYNALAMKQAEVNDTLANRVDRFLKSYSSDKPIDLILLYTQGATGLYATDQLDLTDEILNGLNAEYEAEKTK